MSKKEFEEFNLEKEIINTVEHFKIHEFNHDTNYEAYHNYFNKKLKLNYINKIYHYYSYINKSDYKIIDLTYNNCKLNLFKNIEGNGNIENYHFYDTDFGTVGNNNYPGNACFLFGNLDTTTKSLNINYSKLSCNNGNLALYGFSVENINIINDGNKVSFKGINFNNNHILNKLLIDNIEIGELILENINNNFESFEIRNCKIDKLIIRNSNLGKTVFNGVEIGKLEIENATLNDCIFNGVDFESYELSDINGEISTKALKDNYRQLKHVMDKNGNHTEANNFYALEMEQYMKSIGLPNTITFLSLYNNGFSGIDSKNLGEKLILVFGYLINEFGNNIIKNVVVIYLYLFSIITLSFSANSLGLNINDLFPIGLAGGQITTITIIILLIILLSYDTNKISNKTKNLFDKINSKVYGKIGIIFFTIIYMITLSFLKIGNFQGIETIIYLINPFSGLTPNSMSHLLWSEQIGMIIHKIIYGILIYQLIIALKRTTRR